MRQIFSFQTAGIKYLLLFLLLPVFSCSHAVSEDPGEADIFAMDNLVAWCIVPFDALERTPVERAEMLTRLGFERMAWDWRMEHIETLPVEIETLGEYGIELTAVWFWIDRGMDDGFLPHHEQIFEAIANSGTVTDLWASFSSDYFTGLTNEEKVRSAAGAITKLHDRVRGYGCRVALYNHMDWFGEPENQVRIIEQTGRDSIGIVYNFHHAHHHIDDFSGLLEIMMPYLYTVNLNGMRRDGPKILDIGSGDHEAEMMGVLARSGFDGTVGILGHTEGEDIEKVLRRNLEGLHSVTGQPGGL